MDKIHLTWADIDKATDNIVLQIKEKGLKPDTILGIPRGGLIIAVILSHKLNIPYTTSIKKMQESALILMADDISDTGKTFQNELKYQSLFFSLKKFITSSIHIAPNTSFIPDIFYQKTNGEWIVYPWETDNTSKADYKE